METNDIRKARGKRIVRVMTMMLMGILAFILFGFVAMWLWNWLMPAIFGLKTITFWQAVGLVILGKLLFGGFHRHGSRRGKDWRRMRDFWERMTPEERERFRQAMGGSWGTAPQQKA